VPVADLRRMLNEDRLAPAMRCCSCGPGCVGRIFLRGARSTGVLGLQGIEWKHALELDSCVITEGINLAEAVTRRVRIARCQTGPVDLEGAKMNGDLILSAAQLDGQGGPALAADGFTVTGDVFCDQGFRAIGEVRLPGARISGQLFLTSAQLDGGIAPSLTATRLSVTGGMICDEGFRAIGEVRIPGARINGQLILTGAQLDGGAGLALSADGLTVGYDMFCNGGFHATGEVGEVGEHHSGARRWA
jgi:hypothetical protein